MGTPEGNVKAAVKGYLRTLPDCWWFMPAAHGYGVNGIPDFVGCYKGVFFAIETKAPGKLSRLTPLQRQQIAAINKAHGYAIVTDGLPRVVEMFRLINVSLGVAA